jgi:CheY-like chemotaxis protein
MATVMVVDDDDIARSVLAKKLIALGHTAVLAGDGASAVRQAQTCRPDVVLLDIGLPDGNALHIIRTLRGLPELGEVKVLVVSARDAAEVRLEALDAGATGYFEKGRGVQPIVEGVLEALAS